MCKQLNIKYIPNNSVTLKGRAKMLTIKVDVEQTENEDNQNKIAVAIECNGSGSPLEIGYVEVISKLIKKALDSGCINTLAHLKAIEAMAKTKGEGCCHCENCKDKDKSTPESPVRSVS